MPHRTFPLIGGLMLAGGLLLSIAVSGQEPQKGKSEPGKPSSSAEYFRPVWQLGDEWVVETDSIQQQSRDDKLPSPQAVKWRFRVAAVQQLAGRECYVITIVCQGESRNQPTTQLWVDKQSLTLRQMQTQLPVPGGFRTITESYEFAEGKPAPVLGPLTALPVDLPVFPNQAVGARTKSLGSFEYEAVSGPSGAKAVDEVSFVVPVEQSFVVTPVSGVKGLLNPGMEKAVGQDSLAAVQLQGAGRQVRQIWKARMPWPVYAENGSTKARLISVRRANDPSDK